MGRGGGEGSAAGSGRSRGWLAGRIVGRRHGGGPRFFRDSSRCDVHD